MRKALIVAAIWAAGLGAAAQFGKIAVLFDALTLAYPDRGSVGLGLMVSIVGLVGLVFGTTAGLVVARVGLKRAMVAALVLGAVLSAVQAMGLSWLPMMASRAVEGVSHLAIVVVGPAAMAAAASDRFQPLAMTLWSSFFGVAFAVLPLVAPPILAAGGVPAFFGLHALWMAGCALVLALILPSDPAVAAAGGGGSLLGQHVEIYASPRVAAPAMGFVCYTITYVAVLTLLPPMMPEAARTLVASGMPLVSIAVSLTLGVWLLGRMTAVALVQAGFAAAAVAAVLVPVFWGQGAAVAAALLLAAALGIVQGASFAAIPQLNPLPADRMRAAGAVAQLGNLGTTTGTPLLAMILAGIGPAGIAAFVVPFSLTGIAIHALQRQRRLSG